MSVLALIPVKLYRLSYTVDVNTVSLQHEGYNNVWIHYNMHIHLSTAASSRSLVAIRGIAPAQVSAILFVYMHFSGL